MFIQLFYCYSGEFQWELTWRVFTQEDKATSTNSRVEKSQCVQLIRGLLTSHSVVYLHNQS